MISVFNVDLFYCVYLFADSQQSVFICWHHTITFVQFERMRCGSHKTLEIGTTKVKSPPTPQLASCIYVQVPQLCQVYALPLVVAQGTTRGQKSRNWFFNRRCAKFLKLRADSRNCGGGSRVNCGYHCGGADDKNDSPGNGFVEW